MARSTGRNDHAAANGQHTDLFDPHEDVPVRGAVSDGFDAVRAQLEQYIDQDPTYSAQIALFRKGEPVVDLVGGHRLTQDSLGSVFSVTKAVAALVVALLVERNVLHVDAAVRHYWPSFAAAGKSEITVRQLLSHQAGLPALDQQLSIENLTQSQEAAARLAAMRPLWRPGTAFGYHALTYGVLVEELVRQAAGESLQRIFEREIRTPLNVDVYLGLPAALRHRHRPMEPPVVSDPPAHVVELAPENSLARYCFALQKDGAEDPQRMLWVNDPAMLHTGPAAAGGVATARGLAALFAATIGVKRSGLWSEAVIGQMSQQHSWGYDRVLGKLNCFAIGFMKPHPGLEIGSPWAFGHDGAGGALAFADPASDLALGYIPFPMQLPGGADPKAIRLAQLAQQCARE